MTSTIRTKLYAWSVAALAALIVVWQTLDASSSRGPCNGPVNGALTECHHTDLRTMIFWVALLAVAYVLPVTLGYGTEVTMGIPIVLALAILFSPWYAMLLAGIGAIDLRELRGEIALHRALFNRAQVTLAVGIAAAVLSPFREIFYRAFAQVTEGAPTVDLPLWGLTFAIAAAALLHMLVNLGLVSFAVHFEKGVSAWEAFRGMLPAPIAGFVISYILLTGLGVVTALAYLEFGKIAVATILIPTIFARLSLLGARAQQELSERVQRQQQALLEATEKVFQERETERKRIAEDIHDSSLQMLAAAAYSCGNAGEFVSAGETEHAHHALLAARNALEDAIKGLRESLVDLRRSSVEEGGLLETIHKYVDQVSTVWGTEVRIEGGIDHEPPIPVALAAFQILQEGLINAMKHAQSSTVVVTISNSEGKVHIVVEDDGPGFDPKEEVGADHVGMRLMNERAARVGGHITLDSERGSGTRLEATLPAGVAR